MFWDSGLEAEEGGLRSEDDVFEADGRGYLAGAGWMVSAPGDAPGDGPHSAAAAVYVPHIPGYDRVFTHVRHVAPAATVENGVEGVDADSENDDPRSSNCFLP